MINPFGAMIVGSIAGTVSVLGYRYLTVKLNYFLKELILILLNYEYFVVIIYTRNCSRWLTESLAFTTLVASIICTVCRAWLPESLGLSRPLPPPKRNMVTGEITYYYSNWNKKTILKHFFGTCFVKFVSAILCSGPFTRYSRVYRTSPSHRTPS